MLELFNHFIRRYHFLSLLIALIVTNNVLSVGLPLGMAYYGIIFGALVLLLLSGGLETMRWPYFVFLLVCVISIVFNNVPDLFQPWMRLALFAIAMALFSPMMQSSLLRRFRIETFVIILYLQLVVVIFSAFAPLFGVETAYNGIGNRGITTHLMILGPIAGMGMIFCVYQLWVQQTENRSKAARWLYFIMAFLSFVLMVSSTSRIAVISTAAGCVALILYKARFKADRTLMYAFILATIVGGSYPFWGKYSIEVIAKQEAAMMKGGSFGTRTHLWKERINEFRSSPYIGIGFAAVAGVDDTRSVIAPTKKHSYRFRGLNRRDNQSLTATSIGKDGKVETGSGWLLVLSMTGLAGAVLFISFMITALRKSILMVRRSNSDPFCLLGALLIFLAVHMIAEGYTLAGGSYMFVILWLLLGAIDAWGKEPKEITF
ncbi:MAG: O-antigen ligase family protein [Muribaculaceae bacterium]|nr:O-antigen ligase family protein [Muribaculaceae bacterium]MDE5968176.1 O-antigen ligase family protein [Muribaculaceae bacterium]